MPACLFKGLNSARLVISIVRDYIIYPVSVCIALDYIIYHVLVIKYMLLPLDQALYFALENIEQVFQFFL